MMWLQTICLLTYMPVYMCISGRLLWQVWWISTSTINFQWVDNYSQFIQDLDQENYLLFLNCCRIWIEIMHRFFSIGPECFPTIIKVWYLWGVNAGYALFNYLQLKSKQLFDTSWMFLWTKLDLFVIHDNL